MPRYEWVTTDAFDPSNPVHKHIKKGIEVGDALPDLVTADKVRGLCVLV